MTHLPLKRALLSVSDKTGLIDFARGLQALGVELISTGGTSEALTVAGIAHRSVESLTEVPALFGGRVKTLHPKVHGGILGRRDQDEAEAKAHGIGWIDLVVVNLYPFSESITQLDLPWAEVVEQIDIGGPTLIRAAAKNFAWVGVLVNPMDYEAVLAECREHGGLSQPTRCRLAEAAFELTATYDAHIHAYFAARIKPSRTVPAVRLALPLEKHSELRYGENPHQQAVAYRFPHHAEGVLNAIQHQGKPLSYNNFLDAEAASSCVSEFESPACVIVKHANPCGVALGSSIEAAYARALAADPVSAFGGIIALNRPCSADLAQTIATLFIEVVIAPSFTPEALAVFASKPNLRCLSLPMNPLPHWEWKAITGGLLLQERDLQSVAVDALTSVTTRQPTQAEWQDLKFAWQVVKHVKSNGILIAKAGKTIGIGAGQVSRIDAVKLALQKAGDACPGSVLASDAFFPFRDGIDHLAGSGITAIIQPGGSVRDEEVLAACEAHGIAMVLTGQRCFRH